MTYLTSRILNKVLIFATGIKTNVNAPVELKVNLEFEIMAESTTKDTSYPIPAVFKFRKRDKAKNSIPESQFETLTFKQFFTKLLNTFNHLH